MSRNKKIRSFSLSLDVIEELDKLPKNDKSRFVDSFLYFFLIENPQSYEFNYGRLKINNLVNEKQIENIIKEKIQAIQPKGNDTKDVVKSNKSNLKKDNKTIKPSQNNKIDNLKKGTHTLGMKDNKIKKPKESNEDLKKKASYLLSDLMY